MPVEVGVPHDHVDAEMGIEAELDGVAVAGMRVRARSVDPPAISRIVDTGAEYHGNGNEDEEES